MTQAYENVMEIEIEFEQPEVEAPIESETDELLGDLNPRYFEECMTLDDARQKAYTSDVSMSSNFNVFTTY
ncbi:MAG: hypothetical protein ACXAAI_00645 [Promethearchaeota archaeon]|jgi:hypothetical protein